jgi:16S rRNA (uracil1498-N3)-methyltransferase
VSISRIFQTADLASGMQMDLDEGATHHLARVLRAATGDRITVFNGTGGEYTASIIAIHKKKITIEVGMFIPREVESPLNLTLAQGISRGEKMDYTIQKAVELGVKRIIPLITERCSVKLTAERREKRFAHWQSIVISACEQSGRNVVPVLDAPLSLAEWFGRARTVQGFVLAPRANEKLRDVKVIPNTEMALLIGSEGGLSEAEIDQSMRAGLTPLNLGPRILRTETAAVAALTALQCAFGDMAE